MKRYQLSKQGRPEAGGSVGLAGVTVMVLVGALYLIVRCVLALLFG